MSEDSPRKMPGSRMNPVIKSFVRGIVGWSIPLDGCWLPVQCMPATSWETVVEGPEGGSLRPVGNGPEVDLMGEYRIGCSRSVSAVVAIAILGDAFDDAL